jgi:hypothetical protein
MRVFGAGLPSLLALAMASLLCGPAMAACTRSVPTAADSIDVGVVTSTPPSVGNITGSGAFNAPTESSLDVRQPTTTVELADGTVRVTAANGDVLTASYTGRVEITPRSSTVSLDLQVTSGSGQFQGATGTLRGDGTGAFAGEGTFSLSVKGSLSLAGKTGASNVRIDIGGTALVSCVGGRTSIALQGDGTSNRSGNVSATLSHQVSNSSCTP